MAEIDFFGVYVNTLFVAAILAFLLGRVGQWLLARCGVYRFVWHRGLFDIALFVILWGQIAVLLIFHISG
ncbi:DUF1656 domain-containing protein [Sphingomonas oleivorans]|nr:DUF1656 domain-containing protein [Sphingomonas oleivorans]